MRDVVKKNARKREAYHRNKERLRGRLLDARLRSRYNLSALRYAEMLAEQSGVCAICGKPEPKGRLLCVDHDHECCEGTKSCGFCVRALLCKKCNMLLGLCDESMEVLRKVAKYLRKHCAGEFGA
jgi:hypothetical protein